MTGTNNYNMTKEELFELEIWFDEESGTLNFDSDREDCWGDYYSKQLTKDESEAVYKQMSEYYKSIRSEDESR